MSISQDGELLSEGEVTFDYDRIDDGCYTCYKATTSFSWSGP